MADMSQRVTRTIAARPEGMFTLLADPGRHPSLDGAGMVRGLVSGPATLSAVGDAFVMAMNQDGLGDYQMRSEVVALEPGRRIAWAPAVHPPGALSAFIGDTDPSGHVYAWDLEPADDGGTRVTHTYDWSGVRDETALPLYPRVSTAQMEATLDNLEDAVRPG